MNGNRKHKLKRFNIERETTRKSETEKETGPKRETESSKTRKFDYLSESSPVAEVHESEG